MALQTTITLNTVPYSPNGVQGGIAGWRNLTDPATGGLTKLTESVTGPTKEGIFRSRWKLDLPKVVEDASPCACPGEIVGTATCNISVVMPSTFTAAEREDFRKRVQALINSDEFVKSIDDLEGSW